MKVEPSLRNQNVVELCCFINYEKGLYFSQNNWLVAIC